MLLGCVQSTLDDRKPSMPKYREGTLIPQRVHVAVPVAVRLHVCFTLSLRRIRPWTASSDLAVLQSSFSLVGLTQHRVLQRSYFSSDRAETSSSGFRARI